MYYLEYSAVTLGMTSVIFHISSSFIVEVFVQVDYSPCHNRRRESVNTAGQVQSITLLYSPLSSDFKFLDIFEAKNFNKIFEFIDKAICNNSYRVIIGKLGHLAKWDG